MPRAAFYDPVIKKSQTRQQPNEQHQQPQGGKDAQRAVHRIGAHDGGAGIGQVMRNAAHQPRRPRLGIGANGHVFDRHAPRPGLDQSFQGIRILVQHQGMQGGLARDGAKAAGGIWDRHARNLGHHPASQALQQALERRESRQRGHPAIPDHDLGAPRQDWLHQALDVVCIVLVIGVGIDDDICPLLQTGIQAGRKRCGQAQVAGQRNNMLRARLAGYGGGAIGAAIVNHQGFQLVNARQAARQRLEGDRQHLRLIVTGNLNDQFHAKSIPFFAARNLL